MSVETVCRRAWLISRSRRFLTSLSIDAIDAIGILSKIVNANIIILFAGKGLGAVR